MPVDPKDVFHPTANPFTPDWTTTGSPAEDARLRAVAERAGVPWGPGCRNCARVGCPGCAGENSSGGPVEVRP